MTLLIHLSQESETRLKREASARALSPEDYALALLDDALLEETTQPRKKWLPKSRRFRPSRNIFIPPLHRLQRC